MVNQIQDVDALKMDCVTEFIKYLKALEKGYKNKYDYILNMICFINSFEELNNRDVITQYLLNYAKPYISVNNANLITCNTKQHIYSPQIPLLKDRFLSEFRTDLDKKKVIANLGIEPGASLNWEYV